MTTRIILWLSLIWIAPLICIMLRNETKFKKNIAVGVTLPYEGRSDPEVLARLERFKREELWVCAGLLALSVPCMLAPSLSLSMALLCAWIIPCVAAPYVPYVLCNRDLKEIKRRRGWRREPSSAVTVDTSVIPELRWLSPLHFAVPLLLSLAPLIWERGFWLVYAIDASCVVLFWLCYRYTYRKRSERVDGDSLLTQTLTRVRRHNWCAVWLTASYSLAAVNICISVLAERPALMLAAVLLVSAAITAALVRVEMRTRRVQERLTAGSGRSAYVDDDDKWIWGVFYYDPNDSHVFINDRVGLNVSFNMAKPAGKICMALVLVLLLSLPFLGPIIENVADKEPVLELTSEALISTSGRTRYALSLDSVERIELLEELPDNMVRVNGTGLSSLLKGRFNSPELGRLTVCLDPTCAPFLLVTAGDGGLYLFGTRSAEDTRLIFEAASGRVGGS